MNCCDSSIRLRPLVALLFATALVAGAACGQGGLGGGDGRALARNTDDTRETDWVEVWRWEAPDLGYVGAPAADDSHIAVVHERRVTLLDHDGGTIWDVEVGDIRQARPLLLDDIVLVPGDPDVAALDRTDGRVLWRRTVGELYSSPPVVVGGVMVVSTWDDTVVALDLITGEPRWSVPTGPYPFGPPAVAGDIVVQSWQGGWAAFSVADGRTVWRHDLPHGDTSPVVAGRAPDDGFHVAVLDGEGTIRLADAATGRELWAVAGQAAGSPQIAPVLGDDGAIVFADQLAGLVTVDAGTGAIRWRVPGPGAAVVGDPAFLGDDAVVMPVDEGFAYLARGGEVEERFTPDGIITGVAAAGDGFVLTTRQGDPSFVAAYAPRR